MGDWDYEDDDSGDWDRPRLEGDIMKITIEGESKLQDAIIEALKYHFAKEAKEVISEAIKKEVRAAIAAEVNKISEELIRSAVVEAVKEGWPRTDEYGVVKGSPASLKDRVHELLMSKSSYDRETYIAKWAKATIEAELKGQFGAEIEEAKKNLRKQFDEEVQARFANAVKAALGGK